MLGALILLVGGFVRVKHGDWTPLIRLAVSLGAAAVILLVGAVRIYLGTHWLSDVLAGYALGGAWLGVVVAVILVRGSRARGRP